MDLDQYAETNLEDIHVNAQVDLRPRQVGKDVWKSSHQVATSLHLVLQENNVLEMNNSMKMFVFAKTGLSVIKPRTNAVI